MTDWVVLDNGRVRAVTIYALLDPVTKAVRYVGKTEYPVSRRVIQHVNVARRERRLYIHRWICSLPEKPIAVVLEVVPPGGDWQSRERRWIRRLRDRGCRLCNLTDGGEGQSGTVMTQEARLHLSNLKKTGRHFECVICGALFWRKQSEIVLGDCKCCSRKCYAIYQCGRRKRVVSMSYGAAGREVAHRNRRAMAYCKRGHPLSGTNLYVNKKGMRTCKECRKLHKKAYRSRHGS